MENQCVVQLEADSVACTKIQSPHKDRSSSSRLTWTLLTITLCLAAAAAAVLLVSRHVQQEEADHGQDPEGLHRALRQISENVRAAIHLEGEYNPELETSAEWIKQADQYHSQGDLKLNNNEIVIPKNGLYFVYSQASFRVNCSSEADSTSNPMVHLSNTVQRWSSSYGDDDVPKSYQPILHSVRTVCQKKSTSEQDEEGSWFSAVYMGAAFNLKQGDRLKTVIEKNLLPDLDDEPGKTFFGVFAL
ncbi:tumor necrosis factor a (TNF superfamily, member 2) [Thalassophryne amazonica]|uniref:tumor necrosis factor a (TNF superfamily, member 2) n=1 Tax=Thalassophryne amazonica TaxID=390379 RepID=UPI0014712165|nr:tumor necrosis factor a (TNF superfamily, member 2) [Thalassophryne amazonica]